MKTPNCFVDTDRALLENKCFSGTVDEISFLNKSFTAFNDSANELEASYEVLKKQVKSLNIELEKKNSQLEKNLRENEVTKNFLNSILESLPTGVFVINCDRKLLMANQAMSKIIGRDLYKINNEKFDLILELLNAGTGRNSVTYNVEFKTDKSDIKHLKVLRSNVQGKDKETIGLLYIVQDVTRTARIGEQSERDKRLKAMGEMAIRVAHEVRNPLGSIELFASILRNELEYKPDLKKMTDHIVSEVKSLDSSISNLLQFTLPQDPAFHKININSLIVDYIEFMKPLLNKNGVELIYKEPDTDIIVYADKDLLKQVFLNLTINSFQAMPHGGILKVKIDLCLDSNNNENWVEICFEDNGKGMDKEILNKIFNPFYTTRDKGTGLGLAIVHNIIEGHNGLIEARSKKGRGTCFQISLPFQLAN